MLVKPLMAMLLASPGDAPNARSAKRLCPSPFGLSSGALPCTCTKYVPAGTVPEYEHRVTHCRNSEATCGWYPPGPVGALTGAPLEYFTTPLVCWYSFSAV